MSSLQNTCLNRHDPSGSSAASSAARENPCKKATDTAGVPGPGTSANIYGDNDIQRVCLSDGAEQPCGGGRRRGPRRLQPGASISDAAALMK